MCCDAAGNSAPARRIAAGVGAARSTARAAARVRADGTESLDRHITHTARSNVTRNICNSIAVSCTRFHNKVERDSIVSNFVLSWGICWIDNPSEDVATKGVASGAAAPDVKMSSKVDILNEKIWCSSLNRFWIIERNGRRFNTWSRFLNFIIFFRGRHFV